MAGVLLFNVFLSFVFRNYIIVHFRRSNLVEASLYKFKILQQYLQTLVLVVSIFVFVFSLAKVLPKSDVSRIILILTPFIFVLFFIVINQVIYHRVHTVIRGIETSLRDEMTDAVKTGLMVLLPGFAVVILNTLIVPQYNIKDNLRALLILGLILVLNIIYPYIIRIVLRAVPIKSIEIKNRLLSFLASQQMQKVKIYEWSATKDKVANALVAGLLKKQIFISDYLINHLNLEEIEAILAHEIGHIKKYHLWVRVMLIIFSYPVLGLLGQYMDQYETLSQTRIPLPLGIAIMLGVFFGYLCLILVLFRLQERQADKYVIKSGIDAKVLVSALQKLATLNNSVFRFNKTDEKFQTHPSFEKRIKWLENSIKKI